jgi:hypothetical protein
MPSGRRGFDHARRQLIEDGYWLVDGCLPDGKIEALSAWSDDWLQQVRHSPTWRYQGSDIKVSGIRNPQKDGSSFPSDEVVDFLIEHPREIMQAMQIGDCRSGGTFQIISKSFEGPRFTGIRAGRVGMTPLACRHGRSRSF